MKKILILLLVVCMVVLCSCTNTQNTENTEDKETLKENDISQNSDDKKADVFAGNMNNFNAKTLDGKTVTQDIFKDYDVTMVNIWGTYCNPCIGEMAELQKVYENLPKNANLITVCIDGNSKKEDAKFIKDKFKLTFDIILPDSNLQNSLLKHITGVPTTIFVDNKGNPIDKEILGVIKGSDTSKAYLDKINELLKKVK